MDKEKTPDLEKSCKKNEIGTCFLVAGLLLPEQGKRQFFPPSGAASRGIKERALFICLKPFIILSRPSLPEQGQGRTSPSGKASVSDTSNLTHFFLIPLISMPFFPISHIFPFIIDDLL
ncbi:hypothetical protein [Dialister hominis]|uniref:hypothetical protein n=2 Tax=Dialister TaxID=39948 RepID=UPI003A90BD44